MVSYTHLSLYVSIYYFPVCSIKQSSGCWAQTLWSALVYLINKAVTKRLIYEEQHEYNSLEAKFTVMVKWSRIMRLYYATLDTHKQNIVYSDSLGYWNAHNWGQKGKYLEKHTFSNLKKNPYNLMDPGGSKIPQTRKIKKIIQLFKNRQYRGNLKNRQKNIILGIEECRWRWLIFSCDETKSR